MKTKEQMQAIVDEIRDLCKLHGVALIAHCSTRSGGPEIVLHDVVDLVANPDPIYLSSSAQLGELKDLNKVIEVPRTTNGEGEDPAHLMIHGIADVQGHTKSKITVSEYVPGKSWNPEVADSVKVRTVESLDEVESVDFVAGYKGEGFIEFRIGTNDGPFGTIVAYYEGFRPVVIGFIEGVSHEELLKKWKQAGAA